MNATDVRAKDQKALHDDLAAKRAELARLVREQRVSERGDIRQMRKVRRDIARILTIIKEKQKEVV